jgi:putative transposase
MDSAERRAQLDERETKPVIPNRSNRKQSFSFSKRLYRLRWRIESAFNRLKDFRRIATRYETISLRSASPLPLYGGFNESDPSDRVLVPSKLNML